MSESISWMCFSGDCLRIGTIGKSPIKPHQTTILGDFCRTFSKHFFLHAKSKVKQTTSLSIAKSMVGRGIFFWGVTYFEGRSLLVSRRVASKSWLEVHDGTGRRMFFCLMLFGGNFFRAKRADKLQGCIAWRYYD